jgi:hypothetical protein
MQNQPKTTRRIDLSGCTLLSTYGRNVAEATGQNIKIGQIGKPEIRPNLTKIGSLNKPGLLTKLGTLNKIGVVVKPD